MTSTLTSLKAEPVGKVEIAEFGDVQLRTVHTWRQRLLLPPAEYPSVNGSEAWELSSIALWMAETRRLPNSRLAKASEYAMALHGMPLDEWLAERDARR